MRFSFPLKGELGGKRKVQRNAEEAMRGRAEREGREREREEERDGETEREGWFGGV